VTALLAAAEVSGSGALFILAAVLLGWYLVACWRFPYRRCWNCGDRSYAGDGRGNYRRDHCWWCRGEPRRRFGARLLGRGRRDD
jgi:hypothetical protein